MSSGSTTKSLREIAQAVSLGRLDLLLTWIEAAESVALRRFLLSQANAATVRVDPGSLSSEQLALAQKQGVVLSRDLVEGTQPPPHSVIVPFAIDEVSVARRMLVSFSFDDENAPSVAMDGTSKAAIVAAMKSAVKHSSSPHPMQRYRYTMWKPGHEESLAIHGASLGPSVFVSAVSLWTEREVEAGTAVTGVLAGTSVMPAGGLAEKIEGLAARADLRRFVVARGEGEIATALLNERNRTDVAVIEVANLEELLEAALVKERARTIDADEAINEMRREFERAWETFRWPVLRERVERMAGSSLGHRPDLEVELWTMVGAARRHLGDANDSMRALTRALAIAKEHASSVPDMPLVRLWTHHSMTALALSDLASASSSANHARRIAKSARLRGEEIKALGCIGIVARARGRLREAVEAQREALELVHVYKPSACARSHAYLIDCLGALHDVEEARRVYEQGLIHLQGLDSRRARDHESWLRISFGGALVSNDHMSEAVSILDVPCVHERIERDANPGLWARRYLGIGLADEASSRERGFLLLAASPGAYTTGVGTQLVSAAYLNVLLEARARLRYGAFDEDAEARVLLALSRSPHVSTEQLARFAHDAREGASLLEELIVRSVQRGL